MRALDRKLWRDLWQMKGQAIAIALVIMGGASTFVMLTSTVDSLYQTRESYYRDYRFADVFVSLKRAPQAVKERLDAIAGAGLVETRVVAAANLDIAGFPEPVTGHLIPVGVGWAPLAEPNIRGVPICWATLRSCPTYELRTALASQTTANRSRALYPLLEGAARDTGLDLGADQCVPNNEHYRLGELVAVILIEAVYPSDDAVRRLSLQGVGRLKRKVVHDQLGKA